MSTHLISPRPARPVVARRVLVSRAVASRTPSRRIAAWLSAAALLTAVATGCSDEDAEPQAAPTTSATTPAAQDSDAPTDPQDESTPPAEDSTLPSGEGTTVATGEIVEGFPSDVIPLVTGATVQSSSVVVEGSGLSAVALTGTSDLTIAQIVDFYAQALIAAGFADNGTSAEGARLFSRGNGTELVAVAVTTVDGQQSFTVGGQLAL